MELCETGTEAVEWVQLAQDSLIITDFFNIQKNLMLISLGFNLKPSGGPTGPA
jgi:hypothetical protein